MTLSFFYHSSGHSKKRLRGLSVSAINKGTGGKKLQGKLIKNKEGYLGPFHCITNPHMIQVQEEQQLVYSADEDVTPGDGPFHLSAAEKESSMRNLMVKLPPKNIARTKKELIDALINTDLDRDDGQITLLKMTVRDLHKLALNLGISMTRTMTHRFITGWAGKGKGLLQVPWERGWTDESKISQYKKVVMMMLGIL
jgi:hypothetical protein